MNDFNYGPVEFFVVAFEGDRPDPGVMAAIVDLTLSGTVRLLDLVIASRPDDDTVRVLEIDEAALFGDGPVVALEIQGLIGEEDIADALAPVEPGLSVAIAALELVWATTLAQRVAEAGGVVVRSERIPAPVVNELVELAAALEA